MIEDSTFITNTFFRYFNNKVIAYQRKSKLYRISCDICGVIFNRTSKKMNKGSHSCSKTCNQKLSVESKKFRKLDASSSYKI